MSFVLYDLILLAIFIIGVVIFLSTRKHNLERQGILYLYKTKLGIKFIDKFSAKFEKILRPAQYLVLLSGYLLMIGIMWIMISTTHLYLTTQIATLVRAPPIAPLIPYFPQIFGLQDYFPPLYFTYFIVALAIVAVVHEFSHGIFARLHGFKIHSTGFAFLGPVLGAFVEPDDKQMNKASKFKQLTVLGAGTFSNVLMAILFGLIFWLFFATLFTPAGVVFNSYAISQVNVVSVNVLGDSNLRDGLLEIEAMDSTSGIEAKYYADSVALENAQEGNLEYLLVYDDLPFFRSQIPLGSAITSFNGYKTTNLEELRDAISSSNIGDQVDVETVILNGGQATVNSYEEYHIVIGEKDGKSSIGIGFYQPQARGAFGWFYKYVYAYIKDPFTHYTSNIGEAGWFIYYLLWWIIVINFFVALFNMLPLGILDGGRYFYLTIWGLTGSEKAGRYAYKAVTWFLIALLVILMVKWASVFF